MGATISSFFANIFKGKKTKILILGLDASGKTTLLYRLKTGKDVGVVPTIGFNVETVQIGDLKIEVWEVGGGDKIHALWCHYYADMSAIVYLVDSTDPQRFGYLKELIEKGSKDPLLEKLPVMLLANKQDLKGCLTPQEVAERLEFPRIFPNKIWKEFGIVGKDGIGLIEAFTWLGKAIEESKKRPVASSANTNAAPVLPVIEIDPAAKNK